MNAIDPSRVSRIRDQVQRHRGLVADTTEFLHAHPELAYEETESARRLTDILRDAMPVETGLAQLPTAFRATLAGAGPGPTVGLLAVYDAVAVPAPKGGLVPEHSCGHGPIAAAVVAAALALAELDDLAGQVVVIGAPADELVSPSAIAHGGGKVVGLASGLWDGVDFALYAHPESHTGVWRASRWMRMIRVTVPAGAGRRADALPAAEYGRGPVRDEPDGHESYVLRVLGADADELEHRESAAYAILRPARWESLGTVEGLRADPGVAAVAEQALTALGERPEVDLPPMLFSTDFGNVSRLIPAAMVGLSHPDGWGVHERRGLDQFRSEDGIELALRTANLLAVAADSLLRTNEAAA